MKIVTQTTYGLNILFSFWTVYIIPFLQKQISICQLSLAYRRNKQWPYYKYNWNVHLSILLKNWLVHWYLKEEMKNVIQPTI